MKVEGWQRIALRHDLLDASQVFEQVNEWARNLQDYPSSGGDERNETAKLNRISEALLGIKQQHALPCRPPSQRG